MHDYKPQTLSTGEFWDENAPEEVEEESVSRAEFVGDVVNTEGFARYNVEVVSRYNGRIGDAILTPPSEEERSTRRVLRAEIIANRHDANAPVKVSIAHQKRHKLDEPWQDAENFNLGTLKAGQEMRLSLDVTETMRLRDALDQVLALGQKGIPESSSEFCIVPAGVLAESVIVSETAWREAQQAQERADSAPVNIPIPNLEVPAQARETLHQLQEKHGDTLWQMLDELNPDLLEAIALKKLYSKRLQAVEKFRCVLQDGSGSELQWQKFFENNTWIFGYGLRYQFLRTLQTQPNYGAVGLDGRGTQRGDFLMHTSADVGFSVLVDIKTPQADLVEARQYRNGAFCVGHEVLGGVAQLQTNCRTWAIEGAQRPADARVLEAKNIATCEPKGLLIIGHTAKLDDDDKRKSFEAFRRNLHNPEVLTFDELLERAAFLVSRTDPDNSNASKENSGWPDCEENE